jgi:hypothetical protein
VVTADALQVSFAPQNPLPLPPTPLLRTAPSPPCSLLYRSAIRLTK